MKTKTQPPATGTRLDSRTGQHVPTLNGKDLSPTSFDEARALEIARQAAGQAEHPPKLNFHVSGHIKQLCDMVNGYSVQLGLGRKVRAEDFIEASAVAIARDHAALVEALRAIVSERDSAALTDDPAYLMIDREISKARALLASL